MPSEFSLEFGSAMLMVQPLAYPIVSKCQSLLSPICLRFVCKFLRFVALTSAIPCQTLSQNLALRSAGKRRCLEQDMLPVAMKLMEQLGGLVSEFQFLSVLILKCSEYHYHFQIDCGYWPAWIIMKSHSPLGHWNLTGNCVCHLRHWNPQIRTRKNLGQWHLHRSHRRAAKPESVEQHGMLIRVEQILLIKD